MLIRIFFGKKKKKNSQLSGFSRLREKNHFFAKRLRKKIKKSKKDLEKIFNFTKRLSQKIKK
jgi:mevalonate pyrophosphate decarboxylase